MLLFLTSKGHFLTDAVVDPNFYFRVRSDGGAPGGTCSQSLCALLADCLKKDMLCRLVTWCHCLCCLTLCLNEPFKNTTLILGFGRGRISIPTHWFSWLRGRLCWQGVFCAGGKSAEGSAGVC